MQAERTRRGATGMRLSLARDAPVVCTQRAGRRFVHNCFLNASGAALCWGPPPTGDTSYWYLGQVRREHAWRNKVQYGAIWRNMCWGPPPTGDTSYWYLGQVRRKACMRKRRDTAPLGALWGHVHGAKDAAHSQCGATRCAKLTGASASPPSRLTGAA